MRLETVYSTVTDRVASIVLNRPAVLNCADERVVRDLQAIIDDLSARPEVRVVVISGEGRAFCSGIDLTALSEGRITPWFFRSWEHALRTLETMDPIVIAAIHSHCIGGGLQLALAADIRIAKDDARFGVTAVKEGIVSGLGVWRIARYAGMGRAKRLALLGDVVDCETAHRWGLVDYVSPADRFEATVTQLCERVLDMAWTSTKLTKKLTNNAFDLSFEAILDVFSAYQQTCTNSSEHAEAMAVRRGHV